MEPPLRKLVSRKFNIRDLIKRNTKKTTSKSLTIKPKQVVIDSITINSDRLTVVDEVNFLNSNGVVQINFTAKAIDTIKTGNTLFTINDSDLPFADLTGLPAISICCNKDIRGFVDIKGNVASYSGQPICEGVVIYVNVMYLAPSTGNPQCVGCNSSTPIVHPIIFDMNQVFKNNGDVITFLPERAELVQFAIPCLGNRIPGDDSFIIGGVADVNKQIDDGMNILEYTDEFVEPGAPFTPACAALDVRLSPFISLSSILGHLTLDDTAHFLVYHGDSILPGAKIQINGFLCKNRSGQCKIF